MKRKIAVGVLIAGLFALISTAHAQPTSSTFEFDLFGGSNTSAAVDTAELASPWIPVRGASRIVIKTWSAHSGAFTGADSVYSDSLGVFSVLFSDSASFIARDSSGTIVTYSSSTVSLRTRTQGEPQPFPMCADSVMISTVDAADADTTSKQVAVFMSPIGNILRPAVTGSGLYTFIVPALPPAGTSIWESGTIQPEYMRIRLQAIGRDTEGGRLSTSGKRTEGINGLRMKAYVIKNR